MGLDDGLVFFFCPPFFFNIGVEMVVPAFPALFSYPSG
jgi:hypothetical protein